MKKGFQRLKRKVFFQAVLFIMAIVLISALVAGTFAYFYAWTYWGMYVILFTGVFFYFQQKNPELLKNRMMYKEREEKQKKIVKVFLPVYVLAYIVCAIDFRFHWSDVPLWLMITAYAFLLISYLGVVYVFKVNRFASRIIKVEKDQKVISSGPYAYVRHPMYTFSSIMYIFTPLALGSYWGLSLFLLTPVIFVIRLLDEEKYLKRELPGYLEYSEKVKFRLLPFIW